MSRLTADRFELACAAAALRADLDEVLKKHNAKLILGWEGKWVSVQVQFPLLSTDEALTIMQTRKGGRARYMTEADEIAKAR